MADDKKPESFNGPLGLRLKGESVALFSKVYFGVRICSTVIGYVPDEPPPDGPYHGGPRQKFPTANKPVVEKKPSHLRLVA